MKKGDLSVTSISILMLGHSPISSLKLNASLYWYNESLTCFFSILVKHELSRFTYLSNISLPIIYFLLSISSNHRNFSSELSFLFSHKIYKSIVLVTYIVLFVIFKTALFWMNFNFIMFVVCSFMFKNFTMAIPDSSSVKGASMMTILCDAGTISTVDTGKKGIDLLRKLKHESHE